MTACYQNEQRIRSEETINDASSEFMPLYFAVYHLLSLTESNPSVITPFTIESLTKLMQSPKYASQRQGLFLFRNTAQTLSNMITGLPDSNASALAYRSLLHVLRNTHGHAHRTAAEALGALPLNIYPPEIETAEPVNSVPRADLDTLIASSRIRVKQPPKFSGRTLVIQDAGSNRLMAVKFARCGETPDNLALEPLWMERMNGFRDWFHVRFDIPEAVRINNRTIFRVTPFSGTHSNGIKLHPKRYAVAYIASRDYFSYPNHANGNGDGNEERFLEIMNRNAGLLGTLTGRGVIHSAVIPLFHNRVQIERRRDAGLYEWYRAGRLDRWLESCDYPNFGLSGIRDFEHFTPHDGSEKSLYRSIGSHFLSMMLVCGSFFRNRDKTRRGFDESGNPVDARDLFDRKLLKSLAAGAFHNYYAGFAGTPFSGDPPVDFDRLAARMIDEMGVDRHMEEMFRIADQQVMSPDEFRSFLLDRNYTPEEIGRIKQGESDIAIPSGPHLGGFNEPISLPELIEAVETMAALCISGKYINTKTRPFKEAHHAQRPDQRKKPLSDPARPQPGQLASLVRRNL